MRNNNFNNNAANNNSNNNEFSFGGIVMMNGTNTITTKEAFVGTVKTAMEAMYSDGYTVRVQEVQKNNGMVLNGLTIQKVGV